jgi:hypothetical protein
LIRNTRIWVVEVNGKVKILIQVDYGQPDSREHHFLLEYIKVKSIMELFRRNINVLRLVIIQNDVTDAYLGCNIVAIRQQLMVIASLIEEISRKSTSVIDSTQALMKQLYTQETMMSTISV